MFVFVWGGPLASSRVVSCINWPEKVGVTCMLQSSYLYLYLFFVFEIQSRYICICMGPLAGLLVT